MKQRQETTLCLRKEKASICPFEYPCGKVPCETGQACPARYDVRKRFNAPVFEK